MFNFQYKGIDFAHKLDYASSPKDEYSKHMHFFYEILYFIKGDVSYTIDSYHQRLKPGSIVIVAPGKFHFATVNRNILYERFVLKFPQDKIPPHLVDKLNNIGPVLTPDSVFFHIFETIELIYTKFKDRPDDCYYLFYAKLIELLIGINEKDKEEKKMVENSIMGNIIRYIDEHINEDITLEKMSEELSYSVSYISNTFKKNMKTTPMKYIRSKKIIKAHSMILQGLKPMKVSEMLGFNEYSTFYRTYMKLIGVSPSDAERKKEAIIEG